MKKIILIVLGVFLFLGCSSKPTNKIARDAYEKHHSKDIGNRLIQIINFKTIGKPVTSVFDLDCQKLPCYKIEYEATIRCLKTAGRYSYWGKKGDIIKREGSIYFKKTENGWKNSVKREYLDK